MITGARKLQRALAAAATARGELVALSDTLDRGHAASMVRAGIDVSRPLWVRGHDASLSRQALADARMVAALTAGERASSSGH